MTRSGEAEREIVLKNPDSAGKWSLLAPRWQEALKVLEVLSHYAASASGSLEELVGLFTSSSDETLIADQEQLRALTSDISSLAKQFEAPFALFVCGEFNAGKSSLINALTGEDKLLTGVLPTTFEFQQVEINGLSLIDSPGLNSVLREHQAQVEEYLRLADLVLFVTSVERPITESEMECLRRLRLEWGREVIVLVNKCDLVSISEGSEIFRFIESRLTELGPNLLEVKSVSTRHPESITDLRAWLLKRFTESEQVTTKVKSSAEAFRLLLSRARANLKRVKFKLACRQNELERELLDSQRRVELGVSAVSIPEVSEYSIKALQENFLSQLKGVNTWRSLFKSDSSIEISQALKQIHSEIEALKERLSERLKKQRALIYADSADPQKMETLDNENFELDLSVVEAQLDTLKQFSKRGASQFGYRLSAVGGVALAVFAKLSTVPYVETVGLAGAAVTFIYLWYAVPSRRTKVISKAEKTFNSLSSTLRSQLEKQVNHILGATAQEIEKRVQSEKDLLKEQTDKIGSTIEHLNELSESLVVLEQGY